MRYFISLLVATIILFSAVTNINLYATTPQEDQKNKSNWINTIDQAPKIKGNWSNIDSLGISVYNDTSTQVFINNTIPVVNDTNGNNDTDTGSNETDTTNMTIRVGAIADIDDNSGLTTQAKLMKQHNVEYVLIEGDYDYNNGAHALQRILDEGFTVSQLIISVGNHDECSAIKAFLGTGSCIEDFFIGDKNLLVVTMDGKESGMTCGSDAQFNKVKNMLSTNEYKVAVISIHEPFVTVKSDHPENGGFACYQELFKAEGVLLVLQGHNHNYQYIEIDGIVYLVVGTGTHDTGNNMYPCGSSSRPIVCITGTNGFTQIDINIDSKHLEGKFISNADQVVHQWSN